MARKVIIYTVPAKEGDRDSGKRFVVTEMPATQGQRWALRAFLALARNGVQIPDEVKELGMAGMAKFGLELLAKLPYEEAETLMDDLMDCVTIKPNAADPTIERGLIEEDVEEISTRFRLTAEAFKLHVNFSKGGKL